jgi:prepilin-type N-terminal cleavage/methylation domain-containing protein
MHSRILRRRCDRRPKPQAEIATHRKLRRGFTLVEMLVAMALTLIMVYAIAEFYAYIGDSVRDGRAMIEMGGQLRAASQRLKRDLDSLTVRVVPWTDDGNNSGYFEYYEGPAGDTYPKDTGDPITSIANFQNANGTNLLGDGDDIIAFTVTSGAEPFQARYVAGTNGIGVSRQAEVVWWTGFVDLPSGTTGVFDVDEPRFLFRRLLLIVPNPGQIGTDTYADADLALGGLVEYWKTNDVSARAQYDAATGQYKLYANSLADLARRENRFAHYATFPGSLDLQAGTLNERFTLKDNGLGEDRMLSGLLAFDVRAWDPTAQLLGDTQDDASATISMGPGDVGYYDAATASPVHETLGQGAYVDLYYNRRDNTGKSSHFSGAPQTSSKLTVAEYDTWAMSYERDGINQDSDALTDEGVDGLDSDSTNGVDDPQERETSPPYPVPLRGIQVKIRMYDPSSRQVKQATVTADFVDE